MVAPWCLQGAHADVTAREHDARLHLVELKGHKNAKGPNDPEGAVDEKEELSPSLPWASCCP